MDLKAISQQLNIFTQCRRWGLSLWQCPQFLVVVMGIVVITASIGSYVVGARYIRNPEIVALIVLGLTGILVIISFSIIHGFEGLAEASRMKSEFISIVSHQLRSPISNLSWAVDFLMSGRLGKIEKKQVEYFKILKENTARMQELVNDLLTVSRIEQKALPLQSAEFSLEKVTKELILEYKPFIIASNIRVEFSAQEGLPKVLADPSKIKLVIENLLDNAIRYMPGQRLSKNRQEEISEPRRGKIEIALTKKDGALCFRIRDNGVGIPKEDQKYIFQKFFRSGNVLRRQTQGSGLGLFIAKSIIEKSGGKIKFKSQEGKGSTFWFILPIK